MPSIKNEKTTPYQISRVFETALDLERYPEFLSYIKSVKIIEKDAGYIKAEIALGLSMISFAYQCEFRFKKNKFIKVTSNEPMFKTFIARCMLNETADGKTRISYELDSQFINPLIELTASMLLPFQANATMRAFERQLGKK